MRGPWMLVLVPVFAIGCQQPPDTAPAPSASVAAAGPTPQDGEPTPKAEPAAELSTAPATSAAPKSCPDQVAAFRNELFATKKGDTVTPDADAPEWVKDIHRKIVGAADASQRAMLIADGMTKAIGGCAPVAKAFGSAAALGVEEKEAALRESVPAALDECGCDGVDVVALSFFMRYAMAAP